MKPIGAFVAALMAFLSIASVEVKAADPALSATANAAYLHDNGQKAGTVVRPSGLQYTILKNRFGKRPAPTDLVTTNSTALLIHAKPFTATDPLSPTHYPA